MGGREIQGRSGGRDLSSDLQIGLEAGRGARASPKPAPACKPLDPKEGGWESMGHERGGRRQDLRRCWLPGWLGGCSWAEFV